MSKAFLPLALAVACWSGFASAQPQPEQPRVTVNADMPVTLQRETDSGWADVCQAPCDRKVASGITYRVDGRGVMPSEPFSLPPGKDDVKLKVDARTSTPYAIGIAGIILGASIATFGMFALMGQAIGNIRCSDGGDRSSCDDGATPVTMMAAGGVTLLVGLVVAVVGGTSRSTVTELARSGGAARF